MNEWIMDELTSAFFAVLNHCALIAVFFVAGRRGGGRRGGGGGSGSGDCGVMT